MGIGRAAKNTINKVLMHYGFVMIPSSMAYDWQIYPRRDVSYNAQASLPEGAKSYLRIDNPRLVELQKRYAGFDSRVTNPLSWKEGLVREDDILYFRGDNAYVWQLRGQNCNTMGYVLTYFYIKSIDHLGLLSRLEEDDYFGNYFFTIDNTILSRDLLDSIIQIYFLNKHLGLASIEKLNLLDIGAGYGRLAHRFVNALANVEKYYCTDAVAVSTFISEYYLGFRNLGDKAKVLPLDEVEGVLRTQNVDIAINIHSFSECQISAIDWWLSLLAKFRVRYLMIVPNSLDHGGELLLTNDRKDFGYLIEKHGYRLIAREPKYGDAIVQTYAVNPTYHYLFELR